MPPRVRMEGNIYYITSVVYNRLRIFIRPSLIIPLIDSFNFYRYQYDFKLLGYVIMPNHFHILIFPQEKQDVVSDAMRDFKKFTSGRIARQVRLEGHSEWLQAFENAGKETERAEHKVWQDSFWEMAIFSQRFTREK